MLTYEYSAKDPVTGRSIKAEVQADSEQSAAKLVKDEGLVLLDLKVTSTGTNAFLKKFQRVHTKDKVLFSRQLSTLINAGLPLVQSLRNVLSQTESKPLKVVITYVITDVEAGSTLAASMAKHPEVFNNVYISLITAGEASGTLDTALERLANQQEKDADVVSKVRNAMIYPIIVLVVMIAVVIFMIVKVLPQVKTLYEGVATGAQLPITTRILLWVSDVITHFWPFILVFLAVCAFFSSRWARSAGGKIIVDKFKMRAWPFGTLFMKMYMARFARTGTTLIASGVPLIQMLEITGKAVNNYHIEQSLNASIEKVKAGKSLADTLQGDPNFLDLVPNMLKIGEQSGSMEEMLGKAADYYEKELDNEIKAIQTIIEPVMMILMGVMALIIVAAVLLPIYNLAGQINSVV
jgi:type IV pilus assembly protein PilC